jgi:hypothetical protein
MKPRRALSPMVTVNSGPGIIAPENPTASAEKNICAINTFAKTQILYIVSSLPSDVKNYMFHKFGT